MGQTVDMFDTWMYGFHSQGFVFEVQVCIVGGDGGLDYRNILDRQFPGGSHCPNA